MPRSLDRHRPRRGHRRRRPHDATRWCPRARRRSARIEQKRARRDRRSAGWREAVFERVDPELVFGRTARRGRVARAGRRWPRSAGAAALDPRGRARGAELPRPAVRGRDAHRALRPGRRGHGRADPRHAQDDARAARAREGGGARRRRGEPPRAASTTRSSSRRTTRRWRGAWGRPRGWRSRRAPAACWWRWSAPRSTRSRRRSDAGVPRILLDNMSADELREAVELAGGRAELEASGGVTLDDRARGGRDGRGLHQRRRADALGAGARRQPAARSAVGGRSTANGSVTSSSREPKR